MRCAGEDAACPVGLGELLCLPLRPEEAWEVPIISPSEHQRKPHHSDTK